MNYGVWIGRRSGAVTKVVWMFQTTDTDSEVTVEMNGL